MEPNVGTLDRVVRLIVGLALFLSPFLGVPDVWSIGWLAFVSMGAGLVLILTALFGVCPLYAIFRIRT